MSYSYMSILPTLNTVTLSLNWVLSLVGVVTNTINMAVFMTIGFKELTNIGLFGLALSDFLLSVSVLIFVVCGTPWVKSWMLQYDLHPDFVTTVLGIVLYHALMTTPFLTAYLAIERCLCVVFPMKIKRILTKRRVISTIAGLVAICLLNTIPSFIVHRPMWLSDPFFNKILLYLVRIDAYPAIDVYQSYYQPIILFSLMTTVGVSTAILIKHLRSAAAAWASTATTNATNGDTSDSGPGTQTAQNAARTRRSKQVAVVVTLIAITYIISSVPEVCIAVASIVVPGFYPYAKHHDLYTAIWYIACFFFLLNSISTIIIYWKRSTNYKAAFKTLFRIGNTN